MDFPKPKLILAALFTRPADTTAYASGDLVANNTTAGSVVLPQLVGAARVPGYRGWIRRCRILKSTNGVTGADFRVHFFADGQPLFVNGDNGALALSALAPSTAYLGSIDVNFTTSPQSLITIGSGLQAIGFPASNLGHVPVYTGLGASGVGSANLWAAIEARGAYAPGNAETFTIGADIDQF